MQNSHCNQWEFCVRKECEVGKLHGRVLASKSIVLATRGFLAGDRMFCIFQRQAELKKLLKERKKNLKLFVFSLVLVPLNS